MNIARRRIISVLLMLIMLISPVSTDGLAALLDETRPVYEMGDLVVDNKEIPQKRSFMKSQAKSADITLLVGDSTELFVNVKDSNGNPVTNAPLKWTASPSGVVSLTQGSDTRYVTITGLSAKNSPATVTATIGSATKSVIVEVLEKNIAAPDGTTISFSKNEFNCSIGQEIPLSGTLYSPKGTNGITLNWSVTEGSNIYINTPASMLNTDANNIIFSALATAGTEGWFFVTVRTSNGASSTRRIKVSNNTNPDNPGNPDDPNNPDNPDTPDNPDHPDNPNEQKEYWIVGKKFDALIDYYTTYWNSSAYNADLAALLCAFSAAVYKESDIRAAYQTMGFDIGDVDRSFLYDYDGSFNSARCGYSIAFKKSIYNNDTICLISVRGSSNVSDWVGNIGLATFEEEKHIGFAYPANAIYENIKNHIKNNNYSGIIKYVITGHSRGAAVGNLVAVKLMENGISSSNVYNYNLACPDVACKFRFPNYNNIFNLCNREDPVPFVPGSLASVFTTPGTSWGKFGNTYWFTKDAPNTISPFKDHDIWLYLDFLDQRLNPEDWGTSFWDKVDDFKHDLSGWITKILCPVDVTINDKSGKTIASVVKGQVNYHGSDFGAVIILTDGDKKVIYVNGEKDFIVNLIGTASGTMTFLLEEYNLIADDVKEFIQYNNVVLEKGKKMYSPVIDAATTNDVKLYVVNDLNDEKTAVVNVDGSEIPINTNTCNHHYTCNIIVSSTCTSDGSAVYKCTICGKSYTESIPALSHSDEGNDGYCDRCGEMMTGDDHCPKCGKIHNGGFFDKLIGFFHRLFYRLTHLFG